MSRTLSLLQLPDFQELSYLKISVGILGETVRFSGRSLTQYANEELIIRLGLEPVLSSSQSADDLEIRSIALSHSRKLPDLRVRSVVSAVTGKIEASREHADDGSCGLIERDLTADRVGIGAERSIPKLMRNDYFVVLSLRKRATAKELRS